MSGPERGSQDAVARALDQGGTTDPHIDELARRAAERELRRGWWIWVSAIGAALQFAAAVLRVFVDDNWFQVGLSLVLACLFAGMCWSAVAARQRALRYLRSRD